jgi:dihydroorotate dehydrogenase
LAEAGLQAIVECCVSHGVAGLIVSNTTITRAPSLRSVHAGETGGLSGRPLFALANRVLAQVDAIAAGRLVLIGCGGIATGRDILTKLRAGASLIQLYTAFAYDGPALLPRLKRELISALHQDGFANVTEAIGADAL